jgi:hypothetical protein
MDVLHFDLALCASGIGGSVKWVQDEWLVGGGVIIGCGSGAKISIVFRC